MESHRIFPDVGDEARDYFLRLLEQKDRDAEQAMAVIRANLVVASLFLAIFGVFGDSVTVRQFSQSLYVALGALAWLLSLGSAFSVYMAQKASKAKADVPFRSFSEGELSEREFRLLFAKSLDDLSRSSGRMWWMLFLAGMMMLLAVLLAAGALVDGLANLSLSSQFGLWPPFIGFCVLVLPSFVVGRLRRRQSDRSDFVVGREDNSIDWESLSKTYSGLSDSEE